MPMDAHDIEAMIKAAIPDAEVTIRDLAGDGDHYAATVISESFRGKSASSSTRSSISPCKARWAACCMRWRCKPGYRGPDLIA